jgi:SNF2 family DNA or RNA helicase
VHTELITGKVVSVEYIDDEPEFVYNIEVADNHNYFAEDLLVSNCQRIMNPKAQTTKNILKVCTGAGRKMPMSGTPLENNIQELWSIIDLCRPGILGNYFKFVDRYCEKDYWGSIVAPKTEMMPELKEKLAPIMLRKTKEEALPDLPELTIQEYWVDMTEEQKRLYKVVKEGILENLSTGEFSYLEALAQITRIQQLVDSPYLLREVLGTEDLPVESGKLSELRNIIEDLDPKQHKFILFSQYREMTDILYRWLQDEKILPKEGIGYIHGGMKPTETAKIQDGFQTGDIQCILMTTAGNYGLDLSAGSYVICYDCLFNPQKMNQVYSRAHRNGVKQAVTTINIVTRNTYEEKKLGILDKKKELFKAMIDADDTAFAKMFTKQELVNMI